MYGPWSTRHTAEGKTECETNIVNGKKLNQSPVLGLPGQWTVRKHIENNNNKNLSQ